MGVDTSITFPAAVEIESVAKACAILLGRPKTWTGLNGPNTGATHGLVEPTDSGWVSIAGISYKTSNNLPYCVTINVDGIEHPWWLFYHFETRNGQRYMSGRARAERIALHKALCNLFGGVVDYNDCDETSVNMRRKQPRWLGKQGSNKSFHERELAIWNLKPLSLKDVQVCERYASYPTDLTRYQKLEEPK